MPQHGLIDTLIGGEGGISTGTSAIGLNLFNTDGSFAGQLIEREGNLFLSAGQQSGQIPRPFTGGNFLVDAGGGDLFQLSINNEGGVTKSGTTSLSTGTTGSAPAFSGTQTGLQFQNDLAVAEAKRQEAVAAGNTAEARRWEQEVVRIQNEFATAERLATEEFAAEQNRLSEEGALQRNRLNVLSSLLSDLAGAQSQARTTLANLQPDPFAFAAAKGGRLQVGTTPQQAFQQELQQTVSATPPAIDPNASAESLQAAINQLTGQQAPTAPTAFGLAAGGTVKPSAQPQSFLVGEKGPEVMTVTAQGVQVTPLVGGMQTGGTALFEPVPFDRESLFPALEDAGIFGSLGINQLPVTVRDPNQEIRGTGFPGATTFSQLGTPPRLVRDVTTSAVFLIENGQRRFISTAAFEAAGFNQNQIVQLPGSEIIQLGPVAGSDVPIGFRQPTSATQPSAFTRPASPIIEPTTGVALPSITEVAEQLNQLRVTRPFMFNLILSAYRSAGVPVDALLGGVQSSLSFGLERGAVGLR